MPSHKTIGYNTAERFRFDETINEDHQDNYRPGNLKEIPRNLKRCISCGNSLLDFQTVCEKCGAFQPEAYQPTQKPPQASVPPETLSERAPPAEVPKPGPPPSSYAAPPSERRVRPLILASVVIVVVIVGVVAVALLAYNPFASHGSPTTTGTSCTVTKNVASACDIGNNIYLLNLLVSNSSFSNHTTYVITFVMNNTGIAPVNITNINFDNQQVINGNPSSGSNATSPFWATYTSGHVIASKSQLPFVLEVPRTTSSGAHNITLVDSAGKSYTFSFDI